MNRSSIGYDLITIIICVFLIIAFAPASAHADEGVWVHNDTNKKIWVVLEAEKRRITESETRNSGEIDFESYVKLVLEQKIESPVAGSDTMGEAEARLHIKNHWDNNKKLKYQYSDFIQPGESEMEPQTKRRFKKPASTYYFTYRTNKKIKENRVATNNDKIVINSSGTDAVPLDGTHIVSGKRVELYIPNSKKGFGYPEDYKGWDAGTYRKSKAAHILKKLKSKSSPCPNTSEICNGDKVRIKSKDVNHDGKSYMYCTEKGNIYYDSKRKGEKSQIWIVSKQSGDDDRYIRSGDKIILLNSLYIRASIGKYDDKWLQCMNEEVDWKIKAVK